MCVCVTARMRTRAVCILPDQPVSMHTSRAVCILAGQLGSMHTAREVCILPGQFAYYPLSYSRTIWKLGPFVNCPARFGNRGAQK